VAAAAEDAGLEPRRVRLVRRIAPGAVIHADPDQLHRILVNLMRNARHAIQGARGDDARGKVTVEAVSGPDAVVLTIADDGPGIPPRVAERLFQPFVAGSAGGTGLGLAIARELAANHGGELTLASTGPEGAVFRLVIPNRPGAHA